ncbi:E3 ubiquitin-protein ligase PUB23-like [Phragmites australis]|uniref:E3 ubiquitin-protein ligase PUB23-like n=1 Tax=Phragmites australis TaxID=29695 RepID=UPI002D788E08|nr:E3 ubiquitin-protein ligase PUB23-like [Phragmites australis]
MEEQQQVEVPCYFLCPISLHIMQDPVTLPTGITYDRDGIERWLLTAGTCPLTKQPVPPDCDPTPNHTLRRLIQSWCALHAADGVERLPTPKPPADRARVASLVSQIDAKTLSPQELLATLRELRDVAAESERNMKLIAAVPGAVDILAAVFVASATKSENTAACDEALEIICSLQPSEQCLVRVIETNEALVDALVSALQRSNTTSRVHAALLLDDVTAVMSPNRLVSLQEQVFREIVQLLRDKVSKPATKAALHVLVGTALWGRNRVKAVDAGAVPVLIDMLFDGPERRSCELALGALDRLCGCAEGRAELVAHGAGVAAVGKMALRVSDVATDKAVRVLRSVAKHAATAAVVQQMAQAGVVGTLCLVAQSEQCGERTRERAWETLRLHARAWRSSPCLHRHLQAMYPC